MADLMAGLVVYASTGRMLVFGTVHETFQVRSATNTVTS